MTDRFFAIVDHGVLKPTSPIDLGEGTTVELLVLQPAADPSPPDAARELAELTRFANSVGDADTGLNHDRVIYGSE